MRLSLILAITVFAALPASSDEPVSLEDAYAILAPRAEKTSETQNPEGIAGRVLTGYQGWFRAPGDGSGMGFYHYERGGKFEPGSCSIDLWPDLSEYEEEETFETPFRHEDGSPAKVFSSLVPKTVNRHFRWMKEYGIDGAFVQRFGTIGAKEHRSYGHLKAENRKLLNCREAANASGRCYALMYDLSGLADDDFDRLARDWTNLRSRMKLGFDDHDRSYLHVEGKPLVAIWGVGFNDDRDYSLEKCEAFIRLLRDNPEWGGCRIMLGVPFGWREQKRDAVREEKLHEVLKLADVISPWSVGRYRRVDFQSGDHIANLVEDRKWCERHGIEYLPVIYPGFSWYNLKGEGFDAIPRRGGRFYWNQFVAVRGAGISSAYLAMFDEVDEGTAIFKVSNDPPLGGESKFLRNEGLPPDHFLRLSGQGGKLLRGELPGK